MMGDGEKLSMLRAMAGASAEDEAALTQYLALARGTILALRNPLSADPDGEEWEPRYDALQVEMACELWSRRGAEGEVSHSQGGVSRTWASANVSPQLARRVIPRGKVPSV